MKVNYSKFNLINLGVSKKRTGLFFPYSKWQVQAVPITNIDRCINGQSNVNAVRANFE